LCLPDTKPQFVFEDKRFKYDLHGNLIEKKIGSHTILAFRYDAEHQLIEVDSTRFANDEKKRFSQTIRFDYDALGRRVTKQSEFKRTQFLWDGNRLLTETHLQSSARAGRGLVASGAESAQRAAPARPELVEGRTITHLYEPDSFVPMARLVTEPMALQRDREQILGASLAPDRPIPMGDTLDIDNSQQRIQNELIALENRANRDEAHRIEDPDDDDDELSIDSFSIDPRRLANMSAKERSFILRGMSSKLRRHGQAIALRNKQQQGLVPLSKANSNHRIEYYQTDHLGTPQELTNHQGQIIWSATYAAWGNTLRIETQEFAALTQGRPLSPGERVPDRAGEGQGTNTQHSRSRTTPHHDIVEQRFTQQTKQDAANEAAFGPRDSQQQNLRFQGQYFDEETGLHYNRFRYYDPDVGRFINQDPIGYLGGANLFRYTPNPTGWVDVSGLSSTPCPCFKTVFRGDSRGGTGFMKSHGAFQDGYAKAGEAIKNGNIDAMMQAHAKDSRNPASPFISTTSDPKVAEHFATKGGTTSGTVYTLKIPCDAIKYNAFSPYPHEKEWLVMRPYIRPSEVVGKRSVP
jgi:RHS repeat-associated protein